MSIDATIQGVTVIAPKHCKACDGTGKDPKDQWDLCPACHGATKENPKVRLQLSPRCRGDVAGQDALTVNNPPTLDPEKLSSLIGTDIWGCSQHIMVGDRRWANRVGYTTIELIQTEAEDG